MILLRNSFRRLRWLHQSYRRYATVLGIETSCDDTGCAVVNDQGKILGEAIHSQEEFHLNNGGIMPPLARDIHKHNIKNVVNEAVEKSGLTLHDIDAIAVTVKPGLSMSLLVGLEYAKDLSTLYQKPLIPIHHMEAHALTIRLIEKVNFPFLVLLISGGHTLLALVKEVDEFLLLGESIDISVGELYDKVARRLKLRNRPEFRNMSAGAALEKSASRGNLTAITFPMTMTHDNSCNFSFAGMQNMAYKATVAAERASGVIGDELVPGYEDICASFQLAATRHLCHRVERAILFIDHKNLIESSEKHLVVSGGVACNSFIRTHLTEVCETLGYKVLAPPAHLCRDNGAMIAWNGIERWNNRIGIVTPDDLASVDVEHKCPLGESHIPAVKEADIRFKQTKLHIRHRITESEKKHAVS